MSSISRARLGVLAVLREADRAEFGYLRDALALTDGNLSRHLRTLEEAGTSRSTRAKRAAGRERG